MLQLYSLISKKLMAQVKDLPHQGVIRANDQHYLYADIDDRFIHNTFPWLAVDNAVKPDYFTEATSFIGAHISLIYPEEGVVLNQQWLGLSLTFQIEGLFYADIADKRYYTLKVDSTELENIRAQHGLGRKLLLKGYKVPPHITIACRSLTD